MGFSSYRGGFKVGAGFKPDGNSGFPLIESCDIQVDESGQRLDTWIENHSGGTGANLDAEISEQCEIIDDIQEALEIPNVSLAGYQTKSDDTLTTDAKDIVGAINELDRKQRSSTAYPGLDTTNKTLVGAINEINAKVDNIDTTGGSGGVYIGSGDMPENCNVQIDPTGTSCTVEELVASVIASLPIYNGEVVDV